MCRIGRWYLQSVSDIRMKIREAEDEHRNDNRRKDDNEDRKDRRERNRNRSEWRQVESPFSKKQIELIAQNYNLEVSPSTEKIANHETDILTITPKFADRPTKRIFFARGNSVILRVRGPGR